MGSNLIYTANNRDGQTWLVVDNPHIRFMPILSFGEYETIDNENWSRFKAEHPDIILTDHLPDGTKVRGDEIEVKWQYENPLTDAWTDSESNSKHINVDTRQIATLKQKREVVEDSKLYTEAEVRQIALKFFYYWWNAKGGTNTESGFDEWFAKQKLDKQN